MRVLVGKTFGIGNAVLSVPMIKAIASVADEVDVLVGTGPDDLGAMDVMAELQNTFRGELVQHVWTDRVPSSIAEYDAAVMSIPFDGRWANGVHFRAKRVLDGRRRPGNVDRLGFDMWEKHEAEYQMENARELGYSDKTPSARFLHGPLSADRDTVYLGLGYKRDSGGFGASKHFGNSRYAELIKSIRSIRPQVRFVSTGGPIDHVQTGYQIIRELQNDGSFRFCQLGLRASFDVISSCGSYLGNDTGMMHVAASVGIPTFGLFAYPDLLIKNPPLCERSKSMVFGEGFPSVDYLAETFVDFVWGS